MSQFTSDFGRKLWACERIDWRGPLWFQESGQRGHLVPEKERDCNLGTVYVVEAPNGMHFEFLKNGDPLGHTYTLENYPPGQAAARKRRRADRERQIEQQQHDIERMRGSDLYGLF